VEGGGDGIEGWKGDGIEGWKRKGDGMEVMGEKEW
jgi:hypothetical protein